MFSEVAQGDNYLVYRRNVELLHSEIKFKDYLYSAIHDTIVAKQLYRKLSFYNRLIYFRNLIYLTYGKMWLIQYNR